jgi:hypothetical protein
MYVNAKMIPVETVPRIRVGNEREQWRGEFKHDVFYTLQEPL